MSVNSEGVYSIKPLFVETLDAIKSKACNKLNVDILLLNLIMISMRGVGDFHVRHQSESYLICEYLLLTGVAPFYEAVFFFEHAEKLRVD